MSVCRMEETVRSLLQNQTVDTVDIMKVYKVRLSPPISSCQVRSGYMLLLSGDVKISR